MEYFNYLITILALITALLAWVAKLRWSKEYKEAKEAEINAKVAQMKTIKEKAELFESIISNKLIEYSRQTIADLEKLLEETKKSKQDEINKILEKLKENEPATQQNFSESEIYPISINAYHEFRFAINGILGFSELALDTDDIEHVKEYCNHAKESGMKLLYVLDDIIRFSKEKNNLIENN